MHASCSGPHTRERGRRIARANLVAQWVQRARATAFSEESPMFRSKVLAASLALVTTTVALIGCGVTTEDLARHATPGASGGSRDTISATIVADKSGVARATIRGVRDDVLGDAMIGRVDVCVPEVACAQATFNTEDTDLDGNKLGVYTAEVKPVETGDRIDVSWDDGDESVEIPEALEITSPAQNAVLSASQEEIILTWSGAGSDNGFVHLRIAGECPSGAFEHDMKYIGNDAGTLALDTGVLAELTKGETCSASFVLQHEQSGSYGIDAVWQSAVAVTLDP